MRVGSKKSEGRTAKRKEGGRVTAEKSRAKEKVRGDGREKTESKELGSDGWEKVLR